MFAKINNKIKSSLAKIDIRRLFVVFIILFGVIILAIFTISRYKSIYSAVYKERIDKLHYIANFTLEMLKDENYYVGKHHLSLKEAQKESIGILKDVHFDNDDYIWISDYNGIIVYHPNKKMIGVNLTKYVDKKGNTFRFELVEQPKLLGSSYVQYLWAKPNSKEHKLYPKVSYIVTFEPWHWIVGTGVYVDDIKTKVLKAMFNAYFPALTAAFILILLFRYVIWATVVNPIEELAEKSLRLANNDLDVSLKEDDNDTEFGKLNRAFNKFVAFFKEKRENEQKLSLIYDNIADVVLTINDKGAILFANPAIEKMFGYSQSEVCGLNINSLTSPTLFGEGIKRFGENELNGGRLEIFGIRKNEDFFDIEVKASEILYKEEPFYILLIRDITEQKEVEKMKNEFVSVVSHELRTPLTSIRGSLGLLVGGNSPDIKGKVRELLEIAHNNSIRLINLINDILDIDKIAAGKMHFNNESVKVLDVAKNVIELNNPYAARFGVNYRLINNLAEGASIFVDKDRLAQVLTNLLSNAAKFSPQNASVDVILEQNGGKIRISVKDLGDGIPEGFRDKIFDKFTQVDGSNSRQKGGTGLGLSICKSIVEQMQGIIDFDTKTGEGSVFYVEFLMQTESVNI